MPEPGLGFERRIAASPPITLDEVAAAAALQTRVDRKYLVGVGVLDALMLGSNISVLEIDGSRRFQYETVYFDTADRQLYLDTAYRRPRRFKVRVRTYVDSDVSMLEVKRKDGRGRTDKDRLELAPGADPRHLDSLMRAFVDSCVDTELTDHLGETLTTRFVRTTIVDLDREARYTVDHGLSAAAHDGRTVHLNGTVVVECKSVAGPTPLDRALWALGNRPTRISKYCTTLAVLEPSLPANYWHRTLQRYFGPDERVA